MKKLITGLLFQTIFSGSFGQTMDWVDIFKNSLNWTTPEQIAIRNSSIYLAGTYHGVLDLDPGLDSLITTTNGNSDNYFLKLDTAGNFMWGKTFGEYLNDRIHSIVVDSDENIYIGGDFTDTLDFDLGPGVFNLASTSGSDLFVAKYDSSGGFLWAKVLNGTSTSDWPLEVVIDTSGVYFNGNFWGTIDFDPGPGVYNISGSPISMHTFLLKLDLSGNFVWAKSWTFRAYDMDIDANNNIFMTGEFGYTTDFDPGPGISNLVAVGGGDTFFMKISPDGNLAWARQIGGNNQDGNSHMCIDNNFNIFIGSHFTISTDVDPGPSVYTLMGDSMSQPFIAKYDSSGNFIWAQTFNSYGSFWIWELENDVAGNVYSTGRFSSSADFDPGPDSSIHTTASINNNFGFMLKLDSFGNFNWGFSFGDTSNQKNALGRCIAYDQQGKVYLAGEYNGTIDIDPGPGVLITTAAPIGYDMFILKLDPDNLTSLTMPFNKKGEIFKVYPNPFEEYFTIQHASSGCLKILDVSGRIIYTQQLQSANETLFISCDDWSPGVFVAEFYTEDAMYYRKMIHK